LSENISTTEGAVLGLLAAGKRSGYDLAKLAEESLAYLWTPSRSQIYKVLPRLAAAGFAHVREIEQRGRPDKAIYEITAAGLKVLRTWLDDVEDEPVGGRVVFALKLFLCDFASPGTALAQLSAYRRFLEQRLERYEQLEARIADKPAGYPALVLRHGLTRVRATLGWVDEATAELESEAKSASHSG
jgi:PadR family transcriptional regulator, regulatory protein AphA